MDDKNRRYTAFNKVDLRRLQGLQNVMLRLQTGLNKYTPTTQLLEAANALSVHQLGAMHTITMTQKILNSKKPRYLSDQMRWKHPQDNETLPGRQIGKIKVRNSDLTLSRSGFIHRSSKLRNMLPTDLRMEGSLSNFKSDVKTLVKTNIRYKPR